MIYCDILLLFDVFLRCAGVHRELGTHISKVRSIKYDKWTNEYMSSLIKNGGNENVNKKIELRRPLYFVNVVESSTEEVRKFIIQHKYAYKSFMKENNNNDTNNNINEEKTSFDDTRHAAMKYNNDISVCMMPNKLQILTFYQNGSKKKIYLQLFKDMLYYYVNKLDSYPYSSYKINNLDCHISESKDNKYDCSILNISSINPKKNLFSLKTLNFKDNSKNTSGLIDFLHDIRKNGIYYDYINSNKMNINNNVGRLSIKISKFTNEILNSNECIKLGFANKTGNNIYT